MAVTFGLFPAIDPDIWWHLASGRWILDHQQIPHTDPFSYTVFGHPWVHHEWGSSLLFWLLTVLFGFTSVNILKIVLFVGFLYFSARRIQFHFQNEKIPFFSVFFLAFVSGERILDRPHMFSLFFISLLFWILHKSEGRPKSLYFFAGFSLLFALWANLHGEVLLGLGLVFFYWVGKILDSALWQRKFEAHLPEALLVFLIALSLLINPYFLKIYQFPFEHLAMKEIVTGTLEWQSPFGDPWRKMFAYQGYYLILALTGFVFLTRWRQIPSCHLIWGIVLGYLSVRYNRYTAEFAIWAVPFLMASFNFPRPPLNLRGGDRRSYVVFGLLLLVLLWKGVPYQWGQPWQKHGLGIDQRIAPVAEVNFIKDHSLSSSIFAKDSLGSYLVFENFPVFIDGRTPVYGDDFFKEYQSALNNPEVFEQLRKKWNFGVLLLPRFWAVSMKGLHDYLLKNPDWVLVYYGETAYVYLDRRGAHAEVIARAGDVLFPAEDFKTTH